MSAVILNWKYALQGCLEFYDHNRGSILLFFPKLFLFFVVINISCYWWAMFTAFPELTHGEAGLHYFKVQFPVGLLGALFDSVSFFVTVLIVRRALSKRSGFTYIAHLSFDVVIAILATFWVLFVFSFSGWLIHMMDTSAQVMAHADTLVVRNRRYERMLVEAASRPTDNMRNIYFGLVMGVSAGLPTYLHIGLFFRSLAQRLMERRESSVPM